MKKENQQKQLVFIVEDNRMQQEVLQLHFEQVLGNYVVRVFPNPVDLIQHLNEKPFAVVLDHFFDLGIETGLHYLRKLRKTHPVTPIIYHTSLNDDAVRAEVMSLGAEEYIVKDSTSLVRLRTTLDSLHKKLIPKRPFWEKLFYDYLVRE